MPKKLICVEFLRIIILKIITADTYTNKNKNQLFLINFRFTHFYAIYLSSSCCNMSQTTRMSETINGSVAAIMIELEKILYETPKSSAEAHEVGKI
ncbi:hypothetical protein BpHYR1_009544 [Brachionus plicatilis]|uniref:Uncharacterized protein n=1 Tax=Brachionus plicatilis TaxID=10195 RepID=A0A3M7Q3I9_BRAPC|nr:hypothetical protein BpHYR1_009544 [Brachionus plicatilis]